MSIPRILCLLFAAAASLPAQMIISEIYRDPPGTVDKIGGDASHEFIEIINLGADTIRLDSVFITNGIEADSLVAIHDTLPGYEACRYGIRLLPPGAISVILDPDYRKALNDRTLSRLPIAAGTVLLECGDAQFGASGLAADHGVLLYRGTRTRIDSVLCIAADAGSTVATPTSGRIALSEPENREGVSLEAVNILSDSPAFDYCEGTLSPGTYGPIRGRWLLEYDAGAFNPKSGTISVHLSVQSVGHHWSQPVPWRIEALRDATWRMVAEGTIGLSNDRGEAGCRLTADSVQLRIALLLDENPSWNLDLSTVWLPQASVRITELFPKATAGEPEWFEIQNVSGMPVSLKNWRFGNSEDTALLTAIGIRLEAGGFAVIAKDAAGFASRYRGVAAVIEPPVWHTLDNTRDTLTLFDGSGVPRETICYDAAWFSSWPSLPLERNGDADGSSAASWTVAQRATPGQPNAALYWRNSGAVALDIGPLPFSPDNDGENDLLAIRLQLPAAATASIDIYGFDGRLLKRFSGPPQEVVYWDGRSNTGAAPPGPFFVVAEIQQGSKINRIRKKGVLWRK